MKKKKYQLLNLLKKIKKNKLSLNLNTLSLEKKKLERISEDLKEMLENGEIEDFLKEKNIYFKIKA